MKRIFSVALVLVGSLAALSQLPAEAPANGQSKPAEAEKPAPSTPSQPSANPFPEDITTVPVMPSKSAPPPPEGSESEPEGYRTPLPGQDLDPVRSPDDPEPASSAANDSEEGYSSSSKGLESLLPRPEDDQDKKNKKPVKQLTKEEVAAKDIQVGNYYLERKNWKGAFSRFESALVLDPEDPDVFWGLAEANRHLGNLADARANYEKVAEYDPDSRHGKEAVKALKEPEIAKGKNAAPPAPPTMK